MNLHMYQIFDFPDFFEKVKNQKISFKTSYKLAMLSREIEVQQKFYAEQLNIIIANYSEKDSEGNPIVSDDGQGVKLVSNTSEECYEKFKELQELVINLPDITFSIEEFVNLELTPLEVNAIIPFIKE